MQWDLGQRFMARNYVLAAVSLSPRNPDCWVFLAGIETRGLESICSHQRNMCRGFSSGAAAPALSAFDKAIHFANHSRALKRGRQTVRRFMKRAFDTSELDREMSLAIGDGIAPWTMKPRVSYPRDGELNLFGNPLSISNLPPDFDHASLSRAVLASFDSALYFVIATLCSVPELHDYRVRSHNSLISPICVFHSSACTVSSIM